MSKLSVTLIDVGWGDSILVESVTDGGEAHFGLIDCNDTTISRSSFLFVKRFLERRGITPNPDNRIFDFVMLTHGHADHANGIQAMLSEFQTDWFWYPKSVEFGGFAKIIRYANRYSKVNRHQAVDRTKILPDFGDVELNILWPPFEQDGPHDPHDENNNSIVLSLTLGQVSFVLTGDCQAENWDEINQVLPQNIALFQVPHHGAVNGVFDAQQNTPWLDQLPASTNLAMSCHIRPHNHPASTVIQELESRNIDPKRTDIHYHLEFETDGTLDGEGNPSIKPRWTH